MTQKNITLIGAPVDCGKRRRGCLMGPDAYRTAGLAEALQGLGHTVADRGNLSPAPVDDIQHANPAVHALAENIGWTRTLTEAARTEAKDAMPIFLGGDHALAAGTVAGMAAHAQDIGKPFVHALARRAPGHPHP